MSENRKAANARKALMAAVITEIQLGIAMAKSRGVVCGSPRNIRITALSRPTPSIRKSR